MYGYGSYDVDGRRVALQTRAAYAPQSFGPALSAVPTAQPNVPPGLVVGPATAAGVYTGAAGGIAPSTSGYVAGVEGYGTADNNALATARAADNPWSFRDSPVLPALLFLIVGLLGLRLIHWRRA